MDKQERARRQRAMMTLRDWMETNEISRQSVADTMGITRGHLSTLINANRTPSKRQVDIALNMVDGTPIPSPQPDATKSRRKGKKTTPVREATPCRTPVDSGLRPLTEFEVNFVTTVAEAWAKSNPNASADQFIHVVRALSIGIRT
ncbi:MAG: hypothetical protein AB7L09_01460 [Nitrospira sp.]